MNDDFVATNCGPSASIGAHLLYEDPELGFQNRAIHSIAYPAGGRFIRVTGTNLENIAGGRYDSEAGTRVIEKRPNFRGAA